MHLFTQRNSLVALGLLLLSACSTPADVAYCERLGITPNSSEYANCMGYFQRQDAWFQSDYMQCAAQADITYPPTLYDRGRTAVMHGGYSFGRYYGTEFVDIEPDYAHNAMVDNLRERIILPCMQSKGWRSSASWQGGRFDNKLGSAMKPKRTPITVPANPSSHTPLPWLNK